MDHFKKFKRQIQQYLFFLLLIENTFIIGVWWYGQTAGYTIPVLAISTIIIAIGAATWFGAFGSKIAAKPVQIIQQAVLHISPHGQEIAKAPRLETIQIGRELITTIVTNIYQLANIVTNVEQVAEAKQADLAKNFIATNLPLPLIVLDQEQKVLFANNAALRYLRLSDQSDVLQQSIYTILDMSFQNAFTFDAWLSNAKRSKPTAIQTWERVKLTLQDQEHTKLLFDLAAYYNKDNPHKFETVLVLFDHTDQYSQDDQAMSLVALGVHELRTPLTLLRGYIEVFEDELGPLLNAEQAAFMRKMTASAQQLNTFVSNILNIARVEEDELVLQLSEQDWEPIVTRAVQDMALRAQVRGIDIEVGIEPGLPKVGADKVSVYEVIVNLLDNAIKYSGQSKKIVVKAYLAQDGNIETTVQDYGVGVPSEAMPNLFDKFYRNHRNRATIGGTGLGLYLSKAIVSAHGGHIWVRSKEGQGSIFGFTVKPFSKIAEEAKGSDTTKGIMRGAHGWIKNHSLYRR